MRTYIGFVSSYLVVFGGIIYAGSEFLGSVSGEFGFGHVFAMMCGLLVPFLDWKEARASFVKLLLAPPVVAMTALGIYYGLIHLLLPREAMFQACASVGVIATMLAIYAEGRRIPLKFWR